MDIIDRRPDGSGKGSNSRKKFLDRYKSRIRDKLHDKVRDTNIEDLTSGEFDRKITIDSPIDLPDIGVDPESGTSHRVLIGNDRLIAGDKIPKPQGGASQPGNQAGNGGDERAVEEYSFTLSKEEFLDIYFGDLKLPNLKKESAELITTEKMSPAGYTKYGPPPRLDVKETFKRAFARRIATKSAGKKPAFLVDDDLRYRNLVPVVKKSKSAVVFFAADCSGSVTQTHRGLMKYFFFLMHLFLHQQYASVEIVFLTHTATAFEVDEDEFFNENRSGGTMASSVLALALEIYEERYKNRNTNWYMLHASDGDNWGRDTGLYLELLTQKILPHIQFFWYVNIDLNTREYPPLDPSLYEAISELSDPLIQCADVRDRPSALSEFRRLLQRSSE